MFVHQNIFFYFFFRANYSQGQVFGNHGTHKSTHGFARFMMIRFHSTASRCLIVGGGGGLCAQCGKNIGKHLGKHRKTLTKLKKRKKCGPGWGPARGLGPAPVSIVLLINFIASYDFSYPRIQNLSMFLYRM